MQVQFNKQRNFLYTLQLNLAYPNQEIVSDLEQETWYPDEAGYGQNSFPTRYRVKQVTQPRLLDLEKFVEHGDFKQQILKILWNDPENFSSQWGVSEDRMDAMTFIYGIFTKDCPGYFIRPHTDDRMHVVQGMIYFIDGDDAQQSTQFYTTKEGDNPFRVPTGSGKGYFAANVNDGWHTGQNSSAKDRYSLIFGIRLNL